MRTKDGKWKISINLYFISMNVLVFVGVSIVSAIISALIYLGFHRLVEIPEAIYTIIISIAMGSVVTAFFVSESSCPNQSSEQGNEAGGAGKLYGKA